jgi:hypothetical protein
MDKKTLKITLNDLLEEIESVFEFVKSQAAVAGGNLNRTQALGDADETERAVLSRVMELGRKLMILYLAELSSAGDLGNRTVINKTEYVRRIKDREVNCLTIFGEVGFLHSLYYAEDGSLLKPIEAMANLPRRKASYFVQDLLTRLAIDQTYEKSRNFLEGFSGISTSKCTAEKIVNEMAEHHEKYEIANNLPKKTKEGIIPVASFDGKGIHVVPEDRKGATGTKRESLVSATYTVNPNPRTAEQVVNSLLFEKRLSKKDKKTGELLESARNIHYNASIQKEKSEVFQEAKDVINKRFSTMLIPLVCIMDGATILWKHARDYFPNATYILDIMHVLEYIWKAANVLETNKEKTRQLVATYLQLILEGKVKIVISALRQRITKNGIKGSKLEDLKTVITYFENHIPYMNYHTYLANGYPIGTGVIESACGHIVKDRMDKSGARWKVIGAEPVLKLRCINANSDWKLYLNNRKNWERNMLYSNMLQAA